MPDCAASAAGPEFAQGAARLAGLAAVMFGWRPGEFWAATPAELAGVIAALRGDEFDGLSGDEFATLRERFPDG